MVPKQNPPPLKHLNTVPRNFEIPLTEMSSEVQTKAHPTIHLLPPILIYGYQPLPVSLTWLIEELGLLQPQCWPRLPQLARPKTDTLIFWYQGTITTTHDFVDSRKFSAKYVRYSFKEHFNFTTSNILRDLATIEADVTSHLEAVLRERLSKINRDKILQEQRCHDMNGHKKTDRNRRGKCIISFNT